MLEQLPLAALEGSLHLHSAAGPTVAFQFQRVGFFCVDDTSTVKKPVFNRIVALKEEKARKAL